MYEDDRAFEGGDEDPRTTRLRKTEADEQSIASPAAARGPDDDGESRLAFARGADTAKRFLDDLLADLPDDAVINLVIEGPLSGEPATETVWEDTVERLFGGALDEILESLVPGGRLYVVNRSGDQVFAVATRGSVAEASYILSLDGREVSVAVLEQPVADDRFEDIEIPVPGCGGVSLAAGEGEPVRLEDAVEVYLEDEAEPAEHGGMLPPSDGAVEWFDGTAEGSASDETWARKIIIGMHGSAKRPSGWRSLEGTLGMFGELMMQHCVEEKKDGKCILQGELLGDRRAKQAVRAMYVAALDLDTGETLEEIQAAVRELGRMAFVYSTFSHMKTKDDFARSDVLKFVEQQGENEITTPLLRRYLIERKGFKRSIADGAELINPADHTEAGIRVTFSHPPCPKWRLFLPLAEPYVFVKRCDGDHRRAMEEWRDFLHGLAARLGVHLDPACVDPSRLYYTPRHRKGAPFACWAFLSDNLLDVDQDLEPVDLKSGDAFSAFGSKTSVKDAGVEIKNKWLYGWTKRYSHKFDAETFFQKYLPDYVLGDRTSGPGLTIKCPNHLANSVHTEETEGGTFCAPAEGDRPFTIHCCHAHCSGIDRLQMLDILLGEGAIQKRDLFDPDCLALEAGEDEPPEWNPNVVKERVDGLVEKYKGNELRLGEFMHQIAAIDGLEQDVVAQTLNEIKTISKMPIADLRKEFKTAQAQRQSTKEVAVPKGEEWRKELARQTITVDGERIEGEHAEPCSLNVVKYLEHHELLRGKVMLDRLLTRPRVLKPMPWDREDERYPRDWHDGDMAALRCWFQALDLDERLMLRKEDVRDGFTTYLHQHGFDPVKDYLNDTEWDGMPRLDRWLHTYCGAEDTQLNRAVGAKWMISAVARQSRPGCQCKYVLVLEGPQDAGKSKALAILGGEWFTDNVGRFDDKDTAMVVQTNWIIELSELSGIRGREVEEVKAFIARTEDEYRAPYASFNIKRKRQCVFAATTNEAQYLFDKTGNVRFWPVRVAADIDTEGLQRDRDQLWAEAVERFAEGEPWWFTADEEAMIEDLRDAQAHREVEDPLLQKVVLHLTHERPTLDENGMPIKDWVEVQECDYVRRDAPWEDFTIADMLERLGVDFKTRRGGEIRIGQLLRSLGYESARGREGGNRPRRYRLTDKGREKHWSSAP